MFDSERSSLWAAKKRLVAFVALAVLACGLGGLSADTAAARASDPIRLSAITASTSHTCAIRSSGQAVCWGNNESGTLGDGTSTNRFSPSPVRGLPDAKEISASSDHTCAIRTSGEAVCWGDNSRGQLGDGTRINRQLPTPVKGLTDAMEITAGSLFSCAIRTSGAVVCWGYNPNGELGVGGTEDRVIPTPVAGLADVQEITSGTGHHCAIRSSGQAVCWGSNYYGQLGNGTTNAATSPTPVVGLDDAVRISAGEGRTCAIRSSGQVVCWGSSENRQPRQADSARGHLAPVPIGGLDDAKAIASGDGFSCAVRASGHAFCWGGNEHGQLGDGTKDERSTPASVHGLDDAEQLSAGVYYVCAIHGSGQAACWGQNEEGQLGDGARSDRTLPTALRGGLGMAPGTGETFAAVREHGKVTVRRKGRSAFRVLREESVLPAGSSIDATQGWVRVASSEPGGSQQIADLHGGPFTVMQMRGAALTTIALAKTPAVGCDNAKRTSMATAARVLLSSGTSRFQTRGRHGAASASEATWLTSESCAGTRFEVKRGTVRVRDFSRHRGLVLRKGQSYLASGLVRVPPK